MGSCGWGNIAHLFTSKFYCWTVSVEYLHNILTIISFRICSSFCEFVNFVVIITVNTAVLIIGGI